MLEAQNTISVEPMEKGTFALSAVIVVGKNGINFTHECLCFIHRVICGGILSPEIFACYSKWILMIKLQKMIENDTKCCLYDGLFSHILLKLEDKNNLSRGVTGKKASCPSF